MPTESIFLTWVKITCTTLIATFVLAAKSAAHTLDAPEIFAIAKADRAGLSGDLQNITLASYSPEARDEIIRLNILGFLQKADYSGHFSKTAVQKCRSFLRANAKKLQRVENVYGVSKKVIAALLWVETRHGANIGTTNVPLTYFSLLQADHPDVIRNTIEAASLRAPASAKEVNHLIVTRSVRKAKWALQELQALDRIRTQRKIEITDLAGSYAGAFGIPQFLPSSYLKWARSKKNRHAPDLFRMNDAIQSVASYLRSNGWKPHNQSAKRAALHHYNNSDAYVEVIMKLARAI